MAKVEFKERDPNKVKQATLCFLLKEEGGEREILLAMKKRGFGKGLWNGTGGKYNSELDTEFIDTVKRETEEEIGIVPTELSKVALLHFYFTNDPDKQNWNQDVHVYFSKTWVGELQESGEMRPKWFAVSEIPYGEMWDDDDLWLPLVLAGERVEAWFKFDENNKVTASKVRRLEDK